MHPAQIHTAYPGQSKKRSEMCTGWMWSQGRCTPFKSVYPGLHTHPPHPCIHTHLLDAYLGMFCDPWGVRLTMTSYMAVTASMQESTQR